VKPNIIPYGRKFLAVFALLLTGAAVSGIAFASSSGKKAEVREAKAPAAAVSATAGGPPAFVSTIAAREAGRSGDAAPASAAWIATTRQDAMNADSGDQVDSNQPVYYVILHGRFVDQKAHMPSGVSPPTGTVLSITIDASTQQVLDYALSDHQPNLARVGGAAPLALP
jgi:hypothetical protein